MELETFDDVLESIESNSNRPFHLLLGNGFSMAYDHEIFSYDALNEFVANIDDDLLSTLFEIVNTKNFEQVMQQLDNFYELIEALGSDPQLKDKVEEASQRLKGSLVEAVGTLHPEHVFEVPQHQNDACASFLSTFLDSEGSMYTTNYDLLLYWVLMRNDVLDSVDGFGRERLNPGEDLPEDEIEYSELRWGKHKGEQDIFYLHGTLPIFDTGVEIVKEVYDSRNYLLENVRERMERKEYPIFVTAGDAQEKLEHIMHNRYLTHCYESLCNIRGSLVTFGFNFGEYDEHIIEAINKAAKFGRKNPPRLWSVYIGVYSEGDRNHIESIADKFYCKVHIYDASTAKVWA